MNRSNLGKAGVRASLACACATLLWPSAAGADAPLAWIADDGTRVRREELGSPLARGDHNPVWKPGGAVSLAALRDEVVAFQIVVEAGATPLRDVTVEIRPLTSAGKPDGGLLLDRFVESYVQVTQRSRNDRRPNESLGWNPPARPPDAHMLGALPDALIPVELAPSWCPYPLAIAPHTNGAVWVDLGVPKDATPGRYDGSIVVTSADGPDLTIPLHLDVADSILPYRAVSFFAYYSYGELADRVGDAPTTERQMLSLLHRHHLDAFPDVRSKEDVERLRPALDGSLFLEANGYRGPGMGRPAGALALGAYGGLGEAKTEALQKVQAMLPLVPPGVEDVFLYAVDEDCESNLGPDWRKLIKATAGLARLRVGHTCNKNPPGQDVDLTMVSADGFEARTAAAARKLGHQVWVYNGALPRTGTNLLDAEVTALRANAWIAASRDVGRWFLWETTFWNDDNRGGKGPIDPFVTPESFHNKHGDHALLDGLLVYPGRQQGRFAAHSLGLAGVVPSMRLKNLRRGIEDAGYLALARAAHPKEADAIATQLIPLALDEISESVATAIPAEGEPYAVAREALRKLIPPRATLDPKGVEKALRNGAPARHATWVEDLKALPHKKTVAGSALAVGAVLGMALLRRPGRRSRRGSSSGR